MIIVTDRKLDSAAPIILNGQHVEVADTEHFSPAGNRVVVVDIDLAELDRVVELRRRLKASSDSPFVACAVDAHSYRARSQAYSLGASILIPKPFELADLQKVLDRATAIEAAPLSAEMSANAASDLLHDTFAALSADNNLKIAEVMDCGDQVLNSIEGQGLQHWLEIVRKQHEGTFQHCLIVTGLITNFARYWGMSRTDVEWFASIGLLHDIGKARIPLEILDKPGKLTEAEFEIIKSHPVIGYDYLSGQTDVGDDILRAVRHHHEALDGSGYPDGLVGSEIDDVTRILTVCDIYGALIEFRPYKRQALPQEALGVLIKMADENKVERDLVRALARSVDVELA